MLATLLSPLQHESVRQSVRQAVEPFLSPHLSFGESEELLQRMEAHLDDLIDIASQVDQPSSQLCAAEILENICSHCSQATCGGYCRWRHRTCLVYQHAPRILEAIDAAIAAIRLDPLAQVQDCNWMQI